MLDSKDSKGGSKRCTSSPIKVAFFTHYSLLYGANRSLLNLIDGLSDYPVVPYVVAPEEGDLTAALESKGIDFAILPMSRWIGTLNLDGNVLSKARQYLSYQKYTLRKVRKNLNLLNSLIQKINEWEIDILYTNSSVLAIGAIASYKTKIPHVWHLREFVDLDYGFRFDLGNSITKYIINQADKKIAISKAIYTHFTKSATINNYHIVYNGVARKAEFDRLRDQANAVEPSLAKRPYTFSIVGKICPGKGQDIAIKALSLLSGEFGDTRLLIVGGGDEKAAKQLVDQLGLTHRVDFWGQIEDPFQAYLASDAVLMCSRSEGMGRVTVEAMAACRPVIGYDNAGTSEIIIHEQTGLLYKGDEKALSLSMKRLVAHPEWGKRLGISGWEYARERFCIERYTKEIFEVLSSVSLPATKRESLTLQKPYEKSVS